MLEGIIGGIVGGVIVLAYKSFKRFKDDRELKEAAERSRIIVRKREGK